ISPLFLLIQVKTFRRLPISECMTAVETAETLAFPPEATLPPLGLVYLDYYRLQEAPFDITPNPRFLFNSAKHREAFNHLLYGIRERKGFVQLTGEVGAGKTTICRSLL